MVLRQQAPVSRALPLKTGLIGAAGCCEKIVIISLLNQYLQCVFPVNVAATAGSYQ
jgi:hypothetical protein